MLQPTNRLTLIDGIRPPAGFALESAMAVTFTLDLRALLAVPAAFALSGAVGPGARGADGGPDPTREPVELLHALRANADKITVFNQVGEIALPPSRAVFSFLEGSVIPVRAPRGGVVHPKVWVLRYQREALDRSVEHKMRVLITSRNLTFDTSWDTVIRLDESADGTGTGVAEIGTMFERLLGAERPSVPEGQRRRVLDLASALRTASFVLPAGVDQLRVHVLGMEEGRSLSPLPVDAGRSLVISPFLSDEFFTGVHPTGIDDLVSSPEALDALGPVAWDRIDRAFVFDTWEGDEAEDDRAARTDRDPGRPLRGLHAKVFAFEHQNRARLFLGSANATGPAFRSNVEILVELEGSPDQLGIDRLCEGDGDDPGLRALFAEHRRTDDAVEEPDSETPLDTLRRAIAGTPMTGVVEERPDGWSVNYSSQRPIPDRGPSVSITCWPLSVEGQKRTVPPGQPLSMEVATVLESISGFLAFELRDTADAEAVTSFVVPVPLEGLPAHRDRALLGHLIGSEDRLFRYLLALLDDDPSNLDLIETVDQGGDPRPGETFDRASLPMLEKLLRTMRRDPARLDALHPLIDDLKTDDVLSPEFTTLWEMIRTVTSSAPVGDGR